MFDLQNILRHIHIPSDISRCDELDCVCKNLERSRFMTRNQIEYLKLKESMRSNQEQERLTASRDAANVALGYANLSETSRANRAKESESALSRLESQRANLANEAIRARSNEIAAGELSERQRHQIAVELETARANLARESETSRANRAMEYETNRSNKARESETTRSNLAREEENHRANLANEWLKSESNRISESVGLGNINLGYSKLAEETAHNQATESYNLNRLNVEARQKASELAETKRSNLAKEGETERSHRKSEQQNYASINEQRLYHERSLSEQARSNKQKEAIQWTNTVLRGIDTVGNTIGKFVDTKGIGDYVTEQIKRKKWLQEGGSGTGSEASEYPEVWSWVEEILT